MLHARHPAAFGQRLVERVLGRGRAELLAIARAEALDAVLVEQRLGRRHQGERLGLVGRALVGGIEAAQAVDLVAEEIEPQRQLLARREQVDQRAAHRIFAMLGDGVGALVAERVQLLDQRLALDPLALGDAAGQLADAERRQQRAASPRWRSRPAAAACRAWPAARSASPAARPSPAARARRGRRAGSPSRAGSAPRLRARTAAPSRQARASPLRRRRSTTARPPLPVPCAARARSAASHGRKPVGTPASVSGSVGAEDALQRLASSRDPDVIELLQRLDHRTFEALRRLGGSVRPGHDVDVLLVEHRRRTARARPRSTTHGARRRTRRSAVGFLACRDGARASAGASVPGRKAWRAM